MGETEAEGRGVIDGTRRTSILSEVIMILIIRMY